MQAKYDWKWLGSNAIEYICGHHSTWAIVPDFLEQSLKFA